MSLAPDKIDTEEEQPLNSDGVCNNSEEELPNKEVDDLEKQSKVFVRYVNSKLKVDALHLVIACLAIISSLFIIDTVLINIHFKSSDLLKGIFELMKYMIPSLVGFAFGQTQKDN